MSNVVSRKVNSAKGVLSSIVFNGIKILLQFLFRSIFIYYLSVEYLGVNSAVSGLLNLLSVTELGIGSAIIYNLYKPVAENDIRKVNSILKIFKRLYQIIAIAILAIGLCLLPFLNFLISDIDKINVNIYFVYILALLSTVATYFCSYRNVLFTVYQQQYKSNNLNSVMSLLTTILQALSIVLFRSFYAYLIVNFVCVILTSIGSYVYTKKLYPEIMVKGAENLDKATKLSINKNIKGMLYHKLSNSVILGADSIIISVFIGATLLGIYSNYTIFTTAILLIFNMIISSIAGSVGNLITENNPEKTYSIYKMFKMGFFWMAGFCAICLYVMFNPTIDVWARLGHWSTDTTWTLDNFTVLIIVANFYIYASRSITGIFREGIGNFDKDRFKGVIEALINIIVSVILVQFMGIAGVLLGTIISCLCTSIWVDPYMIYKYHFKKSTWLHIKDIIFYTIIVIFAGAATAIICSFIPVGSITLLLARLLICLIIPNLIIALCLCPTKEFKMAINIIKDMLHKKKSD